MEQELRALLRDKSDDVRVDAERRAETLRRARVRRAGVLGVGVLLLVVVAVGAPVVADAFRTSESPLPPARDQEVEPTPEVGDEEVETNILVAQANDLSWMFFVGLSDDGDLVCLSLQGGGCAALPTPRGGSVFTSYDGLEKEGFLFGPVHTDVASLELVTAGKTVDLRLIEPPEDSGLSDIRFFMRRVRGKGKGTLIARDAEASVMYRAAAAWGGSGPRTPGSFTAEEAGQFVDDFIDRRLAGTGAERYLAPEAVPLFEEGGSLASPYLRAPQRFEIAFAHDLGDQSFEVGVRFLYDRGSFGHTYFVQREGDRLLISGGRSGLEGP